LLLLFLLPVIGTYGWLSFRKAAVRNEVEKYLQRGVTEDDLVLLAFDFSQANSLLRWEHPGEFEFEGRMYDVVEQSTRDDSLFLLCWCDHEETRINEELAGLNHREQDKTQRENRDRPVRILQPFCLARHAPRAVSCFEIFRDPVLFYMPGYGPPSPAPPVPPPRPSGDQVT